MSANEIATGYDAVFAACQTEQEVSDVVSGINFTPMPAGLVAHITASAENAIARCRRNTPAPAPTTPADRSFDTEYVARKRAELVAKAPATPRPITDEMVARFPACQAVALAYVRTYKGFNSFIQDLAVALVKWGRLTTPQMRGALNVMIAEDRAVKPAPEAFTINFAEVPAPRVHGESPAQRVAAETAIAKLAAEEAATTITPVVPNGTYTVPINDAGEYRVIKLDDCPESFNKPAGTQIAAYQSGSDNEADFTGFAFVTGANYGVWQKFRNARDLTFALNKLITTGRHAEFGKLWAMESKRCFICGRKLTVPISKLAGIGPVCAENTGIDIDALAALNSADVSRKERAKAQAEIDELFPE